MFTDKPKTESFDQMNSVKSPRFLTLVLGIAFLASCSGRPDYVPKTEPPTYPDFKTYYETRLKVSKELGHRPLCEERYIEFGKKTKLAFLYIHGYGASRAEGEEIMERLAKTFKANTLMVRLPGHGTNKEDQASVSFRDYLDYSTEALDMMQSQGEKVIVFGSSMGGLISTWLASEYPDKVDGLVLANPFYQPVDKSLNVLNYPGGLTLIHLLKGKIRDATHKNNPKVSPEREKYWYGEQYYSALVSVNDLRNYASREEVFGKVKSPVLLMYYYKNEKEQDPTASVAAMRSTFNQFGKVTMVNPLNREVKVEDGMHVLFSKYVETDKAFIEKQASDWLKAIESLK